MAAVGTDLEAQGDCLGVFSGLGRDRYSFLMISGGFMQVLTL